MIYIQFKNEIREPDELKWWQKILYLILAFIFPVANPDFEHKIRLVARWLIELEDEKSTPSREIGLGVDQIVLLKMPYKRNCGYWVDNNMVLADFQKKFDVELITKERFDEQWGALVDT